MELSILYVLNFNYFLNFNGFLKFEIFKSTWKFFSRFRKFFSILIHLNTNFHKLFNVKMLTKSWQDMFCNISRSKKLSFKTKIESKLIVKHSSIHHLNCLFCFQKSSIKILFVCIYRILVLIDFINNLYLLWSILTFLMHLRIDTFPDEFITICFFILFYFSIILFITWDITLRMYNVYSF